MTDTDKFIDWHTNKFIDWLNAETDQVGTHSEFCYEYHPRCAALIAVAFERNRIMNEVANVKVSDLLKISMKHE